MAYKIEVEAHQLGNGERIVSARYSDVLSMAPDFLLREIVARMADKFVAEHYAEIESHLDVKVIAACVSAEMGAQVEKRLMDEIHRVTETANQALRKAKQR